MSGGLTVSAAVGGNSSFASGTASVNWPTVFKPNSCEPDTSTIAVDADANFDANLKQFDPFPSLTGTHNGTNPSDNLVDSTKDFDTTYGTTDGNLLNMTLRNKTTGASCTIVTLGDTNLNCTLSGGSRPADTANKNKWKVGDEYQVEGNALAMLGMIIDKLDELVAQVDGLAPGLTDKQIPVLNISTKELVGKIQGLKQTLDDLRGFPLAEVKCTLDVEGDGPAVDNAIEVPERRNPGLLPGDVHDHTDERHVDRQGPRGPDRVAAHRRGRLQARRWRRNTAPDAADFKDTVGPSPTAAAMIMVTDNDGTDPQTTVSEWRVTAEFENASACTSDFPTVAPPQSLQDLEKLIEEKLGIGDPNVFKLDLLDLPTCR